MKTPALNRNTLLALVAIAGAGSTALADFNYTNFSSMSGLTTLGVAKQDGNRLMLTPSMGGSAGAAWVTQKQDVAVGFDTTMTIHIEDKHGAGADGIALVIQNSSATAIGGTGGGMGFARNLVFNQPGIANSFAVELDMWNNDKQWAEAGDNHVSFQSSGLLENTPDMAGSLANAAMADLSDGSTHTVRVNYTAGLMSVYIDGSLSPTLQSMVDLSTLLSLDSGSAWVGLTSATGGMVDCEAHIVDSWSFTSTPIPAPGAAALIGVGGLMLVRRKR